jgi:hypothetical protein
MKSSRFVELKIYAEGHKKFQKYRIYAPNNQRFTSHGAMMAMSEYVNELQGAVPDKILKVIPVAFNKFNVVHEVGNA